MFFDNEEHGLQSLSSGEYLLPERVREKLLNSWAETLYQEVFCRIDETCFAPPLQRGNLAATCARQRADGAGDQQVRTAAPPTNGDRRRTRGRCATTEHTLAS